MAQMDARGLNVSMAQMETRGLNGARGQAARFHATPGIPY